MEKVCFLLVLFFLFFFLLALWPRVCILQPS